MRDRDLELGSRGAKLRAEANFQCRVRFTQTRWQVARQLQLHCLGLHEFRLYHVSVHSPTRLHLSSVHVNTYIYQNTRNISGRTLISRTRDVTNAGAVVTINGELVKPGTRKWKMRNGGNGKREIKNGRFPS